MAEHSFMVEWVEGGQVNIKAIKGRLPVAAAFAVRKAKETNHATRVFNYRMNIDRRFLP